MSDGGGRMRIRDIVIVVIIYQSNSTNTQLNIRYCCGISYQNKTIGTQNQKKYVESFWA